MTLVCQSRSRVDAPGYGREPPEQTIEEKATVDGSPENLGIVIYSEGNPTARSAEGAMAPLDAAYDACAGRFSSLVTYAWVKTLPAWAGTPPG